MKAKLQFNGFNVESLYYKRNNEYWKTNQEEDFSVPISLTPQFSFKVTPNPGDYMQANILIGVTIDNPDGNLPFKASATIKGYFTVTDEEEISHDDIDKLYATNAIAILFPYLRSVLTDITSKSDHPPVILPTLNIAKVAKDYIIKNQ